MAEELVSHSAGFTRLGRDAATSADELGPLANLVGTWFGSQGWELIAVPASLDKRLTFKLIIRPYIEVLTFEPIGAPVPDRGGPAGDLLLTGLKYDMRITDLETNEPLHLENGMWFYMPGQKQEIARSSAIPHGDCLLALGDATTVKGAPPISPRSSLPDASPVGNLGYMEPYTLIPKTAPFQPKDVTATLRATLAKQKVVETVTLDVSTDGVGGILNIPFVRANANASRFQSVYWIETVKDPKTGQTFQQLQYWQQTNIDFLPVDEKKKPPPGEKQKLICWPHVNVNTMRKQ
jgi:hypothetical protein